MKNENKQHLQDLNNNAEMALLQSAETTDAVKGLEPALEGILVNTDEGNTTLSQIAENTKPKEVQKVQLEKGEQDELATTFFSMLKGKKGDDGFTPTKGKDYFTDDEISQIINRVQERVTNGVDGKDGSDYILTEDDIAQIVETVTPLVAKGVDGKDGVDGQDAVVDYETIIQTVVAKIPKAKNGKDGSPDTAKQIKEKLESLKEGLDYDSLSNRPNIEQYIQSIKQGSKTVSLRELDDVNLTGLTQTDGKYNLGSGAGSSPLTTKGDLYTFTTVDARLGVGTNGQVLKANSATATGLEWGAGGGGGMAIGDSITSATAGSVLFAGTSGVLAQDNANFFWDDTNNRLGIGTASPGAQLQVNAGAADTIGSIIKAATSQTADLLQFQNSSATVLTKIDSAGKLGVKTSSIDASADFQVTGDGYITSGFGVGTTETTDGRITSTNGFNVPSANNTNILRVGGTIVFHTAGGSSGAFGPPNNIWLGNGVGVNLAAVYENVAIGGSGTMQSASTAFRNTVIGNVALTGITTGNSNAAIGWGAGNGITSGSNNLAIGSQTLFTAGVTGSTNLAIGFAAMRDGAVTSSDNTAIGSSAGRSITSGGSNVMIGVGAGYSGSVQLTTGTQNILIGDQTGGNGSNNIFIGIGAGSNSGTGGHGIGIGSGALRNNTAGYVIAVGVGAMQANTSGTLNAAFGSGSMGGNTTGSGNTGLGYDAGRFQQTGSNNTYVGYSAGSGLAEYSASFNTMVGMAAGLRLEANADGNTFVGYLSGQRTTTGAKNTFLGYQAGEQVTTGANNIVIGYDVDTASSTASNQITIGNILFATGASGTGTTIAGLVGVGTNAPDAQLHVTSLTAGTIGQIVRGAASQTANLTAWQNSSATVLANITPLGAFVFNETGADADCRIEGDTDVNLFYTDASADAIGIGSNAPTAFFDIKASTTSKASLRLQAGTAPTSPNTGDVWNDSTQKTLQTFEAGVKQSVMGTLFTQTATGTVANTVTETAITSTGVGTLTLPANFFVAGKTIVLAGYGVHSSVGGSQINIRVKFGSTVICTTGAVTTGVHTDRGFWIDSVITCRTTGVTGTVFGQGMYNEAGASNASFDMVNTTTTTIDTTTSQAVSVTVEWDTADAGNTISITNFTLQVLN